MKLPSQFLLSDLLNQTVCSKQGLEYGSGVTGWMYPPVHRLLGWASRPSKLSLKRDVWRLNQLYSITNNISYIIGDPASSDQPTLDRFPTLIDAELFNINQQKLGIVADMLFDVMSGNILYYLVSRSNPKLPGTSRWMLSIDRIQDQQPGIVFSNIDSLNDLPLLKSSIRQEFLTKTREFRSQFQQITQNANTKLEGWLDDRDDFENITHSDSSFRNVSDSFDQSLDDLNITYDDYLTDNSSHNKDEDPWV